MSDSELSLHLCDHDENDRVLIEAATHSPVHMSASELSLHSCDHDENAHVLIEAATHSPVHMSDSELSLQTCDHGENDRVLTETASHRSVHISDSELSLHSCDHGENARVSTETTSHISMNMSDSGLSVQTCDHGENARVLTETASHRSVHISDSELSLHSCDHDENARVLTKTASHISMNMSDSGLSVQTCDHDGENARVLIETASHRSVHISDSELSLHKFAHSSIREKLICQDNCTESSCSDSKKPLPNSSECQSHQDIGHDSFSEENKTYKGNILTKNYVPKISKNDLISKMKTLSELKVKEVERDSKVGIFASVKVSKDNDCSNGNIAFKKQIGRQNKNTDEEFSKSEIVVQGNVNTKSLKETNMAKNDKQQDVIDGKESNSEGDLARTTYQETKSPEETVAQVTQHMPQTLDTPVPTIISTQTETKSQDCQNVLDDDEFQKQLSQIKIMAEERRRIMDEKQSAGENAITLGRVKGTVVRRKLHCPQNIDDKSIIPMQVIPQPQTSDKSSDFKNRKSASKAYNICTPKKSQKYRNIGLSTDSKSYCTGESQPSIHDKAVRNQQGRIIGKRQTLREQSKNALDERQHNLIESEKLRSEILHPEAKHIDTHHPLSSSSSSTLSTVSSKGIKRLNAERDALHVLQSSNKITHILNAVQTLEISSRLSYQCCVALNASDAIPILYELIPICNRSNLHQELLESILMTLSNLSKTATLIQGLITDSCESILIDLLQMFRDMDKIFSLASTLLRRIIFSSERISVSRYHVSYIAI